MIRNFFNVLRDSGSPASTVIESGALSISRSDLQRQSNSLARHLRERKIGCVALFLDNGIDWVIADLACQLAAVSAVPVPLFFSAGQIHHAISSSGAEAIVTDQALDAMPPDLQAIPVCGDFVADATKIYRVQTQRAALFPPDTQKITFTSGTTGMPKGVCLSANHQFIVAKSLVSTIDINEPAHLCTLPLSTLLENLAGVYAPLLAGGKVIAPPLAQVGLDGSSGLDVKQLLGCIEHQRPNTLIVVPEILNALTQAAAIGWHPPSSVRFIAVGGAKTSPELISRAQCYGIPAYEGYGLSECSSVISLNIPTENLAGSAGRPLPHVRVTTVDGEIVVSGSTFLGYANEPDSWGADAVHTGDTGHIDDDGFIHVSGRLKHQFITSYGRNLSPEWVESELLSGPVLQQAVVVGDDRPFCVALVQPRDEYLSDRDILGWINRVNIKLPDYARIVNWYRLPTALHAGSGLMTENGRPRRRAIEQMYRVAIDNLYAATARVAS